MLRPLDRNDLVQCPYEVSHQIIRHRFEVHLTRCRRNHTNVPKVICPFNMTHVLNKPELEWHVTKCPDRQAFENFKCQAPVQGLSTTLDRSLCANSTEHDLTLAFQSVQLESSENWDEHPDVDSYKPDTYVEKSHILRNPVGMTPSQRNAFREAERKRLQSLKYP